MKSSKSHINTPLNLYCEQLITQQQVFAFALFPAITPKYALKHGACATDPTTSPWCLRRAQGAAVRTMTIGNVAMSGSRSAAPITFCLLNLVYKRYRRNRCSQFAFFRFLVASTVVTTKRTSVTSFHIRRRCPFRSLNDKETRKTILPVTRPGRTPGRAGGFPAPHVAAPSTSAQLGNSGFEASLRRLFDCTGRRSFITYSFSRTKVLAQHPS